MRKHFLILLAFATIFIAGLAPAWATPVTWGPGVWGTNPYDRNVTSAMNRVEQAIAPMSVPDEVKRLWLEAIRQHPEGTPFSIRPGMCFREMLSGSGLERRGVCVPQNVTLVPSAIAWEVAFEGYTYTLVLPDICHNWAWRSQAAPPPPREVTLEQECTTVSVEVRRGDILAPAIFAGGDLPHSDCWAFRRSDTWVMWPGGCQRCIDWDLPLARVSAADRRVQMPGRVEITETGTVWIRVPRQIEREGYHVAFYLVRGDLCSWGVIHSTDWVNHTFSIVERNWVFRRPE
jgi:hypothetical protein